MVADECGMEEGPIDNPLSLKGYAEQTRFLQGIQSFFPIILIAISGDNSTGCLSVGVPICMNVMAAAVAVAFAVVSADGIAHTMGIGRDFHRAGTIRDRDPHLASAGSIVFVGFHFVFRPSGFNIDKATQCFASCVLPEGEITSVVVAVAGSE